MNQSCLEARGRREKRGKTIKPNIISPANHSTRRQSNEPIRSRINTTGHPAGALAGAVPGNVPGQTRSPLVLVLILIGCKKVPRKFQANDTENEHLHLQFQFTTVSPYTIGIPDSQQPTGSQIIRTCMGIYRKIDKTV